MTAADIRKLISEWEACTHQGKYFEMFAVVSGGRVVGGASVMERSKSVVSLGAEIINSERQKGFACGAIEMLMEQVSNKGYRVILDQVRTDNIASIRLHEKLGFETDDYVYSNRREREVMLFLKLL